VSKISYCVKDQYIFNGLGPLNIYIGLFLNLATKYGNSLSKNRTAFYGNSLLEYLSNWITGNRTERGSWLTSRPL